MMKFVKLCSLAMSPHEYSMLGFDADNLLAQQLHVFIDYYLDLNRITPKFISKHEDSSRVGFCSTFSFVFKR